MIRRLLPITDHRPLITDMVQMVQSQFISVNGIKLNVWEQAGAGPPLLFVHATSFHGRIWDQVIAGLPGRQCYAPDMRGHGRSDKPPLPSDWRAFGEDLAALVQTLGLRDAVGIGHSMGGHSLSLAAALVPDAFARLFLIEPTIQPRQWYGGPPRTEHFASRRRNQWASPDEMIDRFADRPPFSRWSSAVLRDYCTYGLVPAPDGNGLVLGCPPDYEAAIYMTYRATDIYNEIATLTMPVHIVRAGVAPTIDRPDMSTSATNPELVRSFPRAFDVHLPGYTHFLPMEAPEWVACYLSGMIV